MHTRHPLLPPLCLLCCLLLCSCPALAASAAPLAPPSADPLLRAPQDLMYFAAQAGADALLLSPQEQAQRNARSDALFFGPWRQAKPSLSAKQFSHHILRKPRGFLWEHPWSAEDWTRLVHNANASRYPQARGAGIVTAHADLRSMPTEHPLFLEPTATERVDFFDFFQHASLAAGTPVYVSHVSADGQWYYVEYPLLSGWIKAGSAALLPAGFAKDYSRRELAVVVRDGLPLRGAEGQDLGLAYVGSVFPLADAPANTEAGRNTETGRSTDAATGAGAAAHANTARDILLPLRLQDGTASLTRMTPPAGSVLPKPLPLTPDNMARLGSEMLGQTYAWGGKRGGRDCSLMTRDLFLPFGVWLPRNSKHQAHTKANAALAKLSPEARKAKVLRDAKPFMTLLGFPGHVGLYVGTYNGEPVMLHNILGLRTHNRDEWYRRLIGKCILSTLEPGAHMPELQLSETLLQRLNGMRLLP